MLMPEFRPPRTNKGVLISTHPPSTLPCPRRRLHPHSIAPRKSTAPSPAIHHGYYSFIPPTDHARLDPSAPRPLPHQPPPHYHPHPSPPGRLRGPHQSLLRAPQPRRPRDDQLAARFYHRPRRHPRARVQRHRRRRRPRRPRRAARARHSGHSVSGCAECDAGEGAAGRVCEDPGGNVGYALAGGAEGADEGGCQFSIFPFHLPHLPNFPPVSSSPRT